METELKSKAEIISNINEFLAEEFEVDVAEITPEANLNETLQLDSLDYISYSFLKSIGADRKLYVPRDAGCSIHRSHQERYMGAI